MRCIRRFTGLSILRPLSHLIDTSLKHDVSSGDDTDWAQKSHLKPGGYIEHWEQSVEVTSDDGTTKGTVYEEWAELAHRAGDAFGKTLRIVDESKDRIAKAGFVDVVEKRFKCPLGPWASDPIMKKMGAFNRLQQEEGLEGYAMYLYTTYLGVCFTSPFFSLFRLCVGDEVVKY
jgi:hypothetical protein